MDKKTNYPILQQISTTRIPDWIVEAYITRYEKEMREVTEAMLFLVNAFDGVSLSTHELIQVFHELQVLFPHGRGISVRVRKK